MRLSRWRIALVPLVALCTAAAVAARRGSRNDASARLLPRLHDGQEFSYRVRYREERRIRTESRVAAPMAPESLRTDLIRDVHGRVQALASTDTGGSFLFRVFVTKPDEPYTSAATAVEFSLSEKGDVLNPLNVSSLSADEQLLWSAWVQRFTVGWSAPKHLSADSKWANDEPISGPPLDGLLWQKRSRLVGPQPCPALSGADASANGSRGRQPLLSHKCIVILSRADLRQRSSTKNATPEEYKLHDLKTSGLARGVDEGLAYVDTESGLIDRATQDSTQSMDVVIAKKDGTNRVHYTMHAESHTEIVLRPQH